MKINILHRHRYWTEYLSFLLEDEKNFQLIASHYSKDRNYKNALLPLFDAKDHKKLLSPGIIDDQTENNQIHIYSLHSPGFYIIAHLITYKGMCDYHPQSKFTMSLLESHYKALITREIFNPEIDLIRYQMIQDSRIKTTAINLDLYRFLKKEKKERLTGTGLICMSWFFMYVDKKKILEICNFLKKELKLTIVLHPCTQSQSFIEWIQEMKGSLFEEVYFNLDRDKMMDLYDRHEFIITDGSGACYEAMIRGCKPLAVKDLYVDHRNDMAMQLYYDHLDDEYFPFQNYDELATYEKIENEKFLEYHYPFLYQFTYNEAKEIAKKEIRSFFGNENE